VSTIEIDRIRHSYQLRQTKSGTGAVSQLAIDDVSIRVDNGEFLVIVGPSGCGKSTLLDLLAGLATPTEGSISIDGTKIDGPGLDRGVVFQQYALLPWRTALRNVEFSLEATGRYRKGQRRSRAMDYLALVGLSDFADRYPHELSGGMKQRVAIARSLAFQPPVLLMDEPFGALDAQTRELLQEELRRIWRQTGSTIIFITHSVDEAVFLGTRVVVMTAGPGKIKDVVEIPDLGSGDDVRSSPEFGLARHRVWTSLRDEVVGSGTLSGTSLAFTGSTASLGGGALRGH
jgi:NitT/TauT family transport system ATP-binding protein